MINIKKLRCQFEGCHKTPTFNIATEKKGIYCAKHKKENMIDVKYIKCNFLGCTIRPNYNIPTEKKGKYCALHKKENMIDVKNKKCKHNGCNKRPNFGKQNDKISIFCIDHKEKDMVNITKKTCQESKCKELALYGLLNKRAQYCNTHKKKDMIYIILESKCIIPECDNEYEFIIDKNKYCYNHQPNKEEAEIILKKKCKYCDMEEKSKYVCKDCNNIKNKKEWSIVRYLRKVINTPFEYNSSKMLGGCSKKRPDIYFELDKHCVIVEIDEHQHDTYGDKCECARLSEIVGGIGGKSVIIIRYNPDTIKHKGKILKIEQEKRLELLVKTIKEELVKDYDKFNVKLIQLYYDDTFKEYQEIKITDITKDVAV